jgi:hypothetical protein
MSYSQIRSVVKSTLEGISTIEKVQDYKRHHVEWDKIATSFKDSNNRIHGWTILWGGAEPIIAATGSRVYDYIHRIRLVGVYSLIDNDATAKVFEDECDTVLDTFNAIEWLTSGNTKVARMEEPAVLEEPDEAMFVDVLCHRATIVLTYKEPRSITLTS